MNGENFVNKLRSSSCKEDNHFTVTPQLFNEIPVSAHNNVNEFQSVAFLSRIDYIFDNQEPSHSHLHHAMPLIDFRELPKTSNGFTRLFHDYLYDFPKVRKFFPSDSHSLQAVPEHVEAARKTPDHRAVICEILEEQNAAFGCGEKTLRNIQLLKEENTFCVVTGQQVGILGGPLYTFYKIITAWKLTEQLSQSFPQYRFVPVFWLEGEDHDFAEVNNITVISHENLPIRVEYLIDGKPADKNVGAVGELQLDKGLDLFVSQLEKVIQHSEFRSGLLGLVSKAYTRGATFNQAFVRWMNTLFGNPEMLDVGVVFISSNDTRIKQILSPIFLRELREYPQTSQLVIKQSAELEIDYHAQIKPKAINLFLFHKGGRYLIEPRETDFSLKGTRYFPTRDELLRIAAESPELLSPNVVLRSVCQDALLPSVAYVAGPSEIAYFPQLRPVYEHFGVAMPMIYPRASATIVEEKLLRVLEKYQLDLEGLFTQRERISRHVIDLLSEINLEELFAGAAKRLDEVLNEMKFGLNYVDPTLLGALDNTRAKVEAQLSVLKAKAMAAQARRHETALKQIDKVMNNIFPNGNLQERELNVVYYMNKYGSSFPRWLANELKVDAFAHQVIEL